MSHSRHHCPDAKGRSGKRGKTRGTFVTKFENPCVTEIIEIPRMRGTAIWQNAFWIKVARARSTDTFARPIFFEKIGQVAKSDQGLGHRHWYAAGMPLARGKLLFERVNLARGRQIGRILWIFIRFYRNFGPPAKTIVESGL